MPPVAPVDRRFALGLLAGAAALPSSALGQGPASGPDWSMLQARVGPVLIPLRSPLQACADAGGAQPGIVLPDDRPGAPAENIFWASNLGEAGQVLNAYQSAWIPRTLLSPGRQDALVRALIEGSATWSMALHFNKGLAGGAPDAIARTGETATNPEVLEAFALLICAADAAPAWPGIPGHEPDVAEGRRQAERVTRAMAPIRALVPNAGAYVSEADYFQKDWQRAYWDDHYARLIAAKRRYDPANLFHGHQTVGSG